jgi:hypothetical protein
MPGHSQEVSHLERTQALYTCQVNSRFLAVHRHLRPIGDDAASFLWRPHPKTVIFRYYSQEQQKSTRQSFPIVHEETNTLYFISLPFLHDAVAS